MAIAVYKKEGESVDFTPTSNVLAGDVVVLEGDTAGRIVGIAITGTSANRLGQLAVVGVFDIAANADDVFTVGDELYWDATNAEVTIVSAGNIRIGAALEAKANGVATCLFRLGSSGWSDEFAALTFVIGDGTNVITTSLAAILRVPYACEIVDYELVSLDASGALVNGSIVLDLWKATYSGLPPVIANTITASAKPTLSAATKAQNTTLTGWTKGLAAGVYLKCKVDSVTTCKQVILTLRVRKV